MKVLLMVAPSEGALTLETSNDISQNMGFFPPLGILYVGTYLRNTSKHEVHILDSESERLTYKNIEEKIALLKPDILGITTFTMTLRNVLDIAKTAKKLNPKCVVVLGGPHIALYPDETLSFREIDYAVCGDGEYAFKALVELLDKKLPPGDHDEALKKIEGIVCRLSDGKIFKNGFARVQDLDSLPFPDRTYLKKELYFCILGKQRTMTTIMSSRGCPFQCTFCNTPDRMYRFRSAKNVVDELEYIAGLGIEEAFFFDDLFNISAERAIAVCDEILRRNIKIKWAFRGRVTGITDEFARKAKQAGCERIQYGIEKATDESLARVKKASTVKDIVNAVNLTKKYGMMCVGNFLLFTPGEDEKDADEIIRFALKLNLDHAEFSVFIPFPGTRIYEDGLKSGFFKKDYWSEYAKNPDPNFQIAWEEKVPAKRMYEIHSQAHKRFYLRPRIVLNELRRISSIGEFIRILKGALIILRLKD
ncbi:MAG: radical SAM protein [Elusimicrobiota bacterium]